MSTSTQPLTHKNYLRINSKVCNVKFKMQILQVKGEAECTLDKRKKIDNKNPIDSALSGSGASMENTLYHEIHLPANG